VKLQIVKDSVTRGYIAFNLQQGVSFQISTAAVTQMRKWAADCFWCDSDDLADYDDVTIISGVNRNYDGGLAEFLRA